MKYLSLIVFLLNACSLLSQSDLRQTHSAQLSLTNDDFVFDIAVGEVLGISISGDTFTITQGFLQAEYKVPFSKLLGTKDCFLSVFPNPFSEQLFVESNLSHLSFYIIDHTGRLVYQASNVTQLDIPFLCSGIYTLYIKNNQNNIVHTSKICKL